MRDPLLHPSLSLSLSLAAHVGEAQGLHALDLTHACIIGRVSVLCVPRVHPARTKPRRIGVAPTNDSPAARYLLLNENVEEHSSAAHASARAHAPRRPKSILCRVNKYRDRVFAHVFPRFSSSFPSPSTVNLWPAWRQRFRIYMQSFRRASVERSRKFKRENGGKDNSS